MESVLDQLFPIGEAEEDDVLAGLPDFSFGQAKKYFAKLEPADREIVQWYLSQPLHPHRMDHYVKELVHGYALADPTRQAEAGKVATHAELSRVQRFLDLFFESEDFFPLEVQRLEMIVDSETGEEAEIPIAGWLGRTSLDLFVAKAVVLRKNIYSVLEAASSFIENPEQGAPFFDQEAILAKARETLAENVL